jgi:hypothetical protein
MRLATIRRRARLLVAPDKIDAVRNDAPEGDLLPSRPGNVEPLNRGGISEPEMQARIVPSDESPA